MAWQEACAAIGPPADRQPPRPAPSPGQAFPRAPPPASELLRLLQPGAAALTAGERSQLFELLRVLAEDDPASLVAGLERAEAADMLSLWPSIDAGPTACGRVCESV